MTVNAKVGDSLLDVAKDNDVDLEGEYRAGIQVSNNIDCSRFKYHCHLLRCSLLLQMFLAAGIFDSCTVIDWHSHTLAKSP